MPERLILSAERGLADQARSHRFFREFALHLAQNAAKEFGFRREHHKDGAAAVSSFLQHEQSERRLKPGEITSQGRGFNVLAKAHACPYQQTCHDNRNDLGEVPQCVRAITLIQAIGSSVAGRPPMTYELRPGLVDGTSASCEIQLRPALLPDLEPMNLESFRR